MLPSPCDLILIVSDHNSYSLSKLCNAMHAIELASRLEKTLPKVKVSFHAHNANVEWASALVHPLILCFLIY